MTGTRRPSGRLLAVFAHPDDETFLAGPILAKYAQRGVQVELLIAAPGDRLPYLECASRTLGIARVHALGFVGSPMRPAPDRNRAGPDIHLVDGAPRDAVGLAMASLPRLTDEVARVMAACRSDVVLVDSPYGAYGHPDHIVVHRAAVAAFRQAAASDARLYALAFPMWLVRLNLRLLALSGIPVSRLGPDGAIDLRQIVAESSGRTGLVDVAEYVVLRRRAAACYEDEINAGPLPLRLLERSPLWLQSLIFRRQAVTRIVPPSHALASREERAGAGRTVLDLF
jgi:LmbE family N-acetylglucosaminyl deacetylase